MSNFFRHAKGTLFKRGTMAMNELLVAHIEEETIEHDIRWFLRSLYKSRVTARADVFIVFPRGHVPAKNLGVIEEKNKSFMVLFNSVIKEVFFHQTISKAIVNISDVEKSDQVLASSTVVVNRGGGEFNGVKANSTIKTSYLNGGHTIISRKLPTHVKRGAWKQGMDIHQIIIENELLSDDVVASSL
ncbi:hypothetical protein KI387_024312 [Taxus chinensis]|uniref:DUF7780 domain-containing protein n=1 Tax=Taxus chinensis TaxID=29808 RepID=A0AA38G5P2_TAXCH|nr:hypothetical protein KI387_024312 [Taxus chinensis]